MSVDVVLIVIAGAVLGLGLVSSLLKRVWLSAPLLALVAGVVLGPEVLHVIEPATLGTERRVLEELARVTLSVSLVATGLQFTRADLRVNASRAALIDVMAGHEEISTGFLLVSALATGLLALGSVHALGGSGVLASFIAGVTLSLAVGERYAEELEEVQSGLERLLIVPVFLLFGSLLPWDGWAALGWSGIAFASWVLLLRRTGPAALALAPTGTPRRGVAFLGWYGPLGVAAIYYAMFVERYGLAEYDRVFAACALAVVASVAVHTLTATPGVRRFAGRRATTTLRHPFRAGVDEAP